MSGATPSHSNPMAAANTSVDSAVTGQQHEAGDEHRAQEVDQREQALLAVARAEQAERVGADGVEEPDQRERGGADARRHAAELEVLRQVGGDEHELEAAGEVGDGHRDEAAVLRRFAQRLAQRQRQRGGVRVGRARVRPGSPARAARGTRPRRRTRTSRRASRTRRSAPAPSARAPSCRASRPPPPRRRSGCAVPAASRARPRRSARRSRSPRCRSRPGTRRR